MLFHGKTAGFVAIATAAHVVSLEHAWEEPIRIQHYATETSVLVRAPERALLVNTSDDVAAILFASQNLPFPETPLPLSPKDSPVSVGVEIGWLGFPAIAGDLCFFSGRVSTHLTVKQQYLVDGVAIHGVSGGPAFREEDAGLALMGVVSAYVPNRVTGEALPGLAVVNDVTEFHTMIAAFSSLEHAQEKQTPPSDVPAASTKPPPGPPQQQV